MKTIVTHDNSFHTDDVFAVATLLLMLGEARVIRSRDPKIQATADYVVDTGMVYDLDRNLFDHHQPGGAGERENGIPYASFGLVWKEYGIKITGGQRESDIIDRELAQPIDAHDNGFPIVEYKFPGIRDYAIGDFFSSFVGSRDADDLNKVFMHVVGLAKDLLVREIALASRVVVAEDEILALYNTSVDKRVILMTEELPGWRQVLGMTPEALFAIYPRPDGDWSLKCVPDLARGYPHLRKPLPAAWAGKENKELQQITGVREAKFVHRNLFLAAAKTKEGVLELAEKALNA